MRRTAATVAGVDLRLIEAVLFDMDGTLVDSDAAVERAWTTWAEEFGVDPIATIAGAHGSPADNTVRRMLPHLDGAGVTAAADRQLALQYTDVADVVPTPGAPELLADLDARGVPWTIVTSADIRLATARLDAARHRGATVHGHRGGGQAGKPDPEGFRLGARKLGVDPAQCLVVEDSLPGDRRRPRGRVAGGEPARPPRRPGAHVPGRPRRQDREH